MKKVVFLRTKPSIIHMKRIVFSVGLILLMNWASSHPVGPEKAQQLAETFWQQSGCAIRSGISANALTDITAQTEFSHLYISAVPAVLSSFLPMIAPNPYWPTPPAAVSIRQTFPHRLEIGSLPTKAE